MSNAFPGRIEVTFSMTADDYARYFAVVRREESSRAGLIPFVVTLLCSIVVALTFREIAVYLVPDGEVIGMVGYFSLIAFLFGASFLVAALFVGRQIALRNYVSGTLNAYESRTAVFDAAGVGLNGQLSQSTWRWAAVNRFSNENGLFLIWIGRPAAVVIPCRNFGDQGASAAAFVRARLSEAGRLAGETEA